MRPEEVVLDAVDEESVAKTRAKKRGMTLLTDILARAHEGGAAGPSKELHLRFLQSPKVPCPGPLTSAPFPGPAQRAQLKGQGCLQQCGVGASRMRALRRCERCGRPQQRQQ
jgi:hypothetical protein